MATTNVTQLNKQLNRTLMYVGEAVQSLYIERNT